MVYVSFNSLKLNKYVSPIVKVKTVYITINKIMMISMINFKVSNFH